jgi:hypothetical protein
MKNSSDKYKIQRMINLLKFILTVDDEEIKRSSIESIIESLEEIINNN